MTFYSAKTVDLQALYEYVACMGDMQYTVRNIPEATDRQLRSRAAQTGKSLNEVILDALNQNAGAFENPDFDFLFGSWVEDSRIDKALADQRKIDRELWR